MTKELVQTEELTKSVAGSGGLALEMKKIPKKLKESPEEMPVSGWDWELGMDPGIHALRCR